MQKAVANIKALAGKLKANAIEIYVAILLLIGLPFIAYIYAGWKLCAAVFIVINALVGLLVLRSSN